MREILFKAKCAEEPYDWVEGYLNKCEREFIISNDDGLGIFIEPDTICQYTGLTDKNGNKIWENDIVSCGGNLVVTWKEKFASFCLSRKEWAFNHFFGEAVDGCDCEVIGNIFDNPELLKGE